MECHPFVRIFCAFRKILYGNQKKPRWFTKQRACFQNYAKKMQIGPKIVAKMPSGTLAYHYKTTTL